MKYGVVIILPKLRPSGWLLNLLRISLRSCTLQNLRVLETILRNVEKSMRDTDFDRTLLRNKKAQIDKLRYWLKVETSVLG